MIARCLCVGRGGWPALFLKGWDPPGTRRKQQQQQHNALMLQTGNTPYLITT